MIIARALPLFVHLLLQSTSTTGDIITPGALIGTLLAIGYSILRERAQKGSVNDEAQRAFIYQVRRYSDRVDALEKQNADLQTTIDTLRTQNETQAQQIVTLTNENLLLKGRLS